MGLSGPVGFGVEAAGTKLKEVPSNIITIKPSSVIILSTADIAIATFKFLLSLFISLKLKP
jgi:hypothetical protein